MYTECMCKPSETSADNYLAARRSTGLQPLGLHSAEVTTWSSPRKV